jgi:uncharacterized protein YbbK (DUF523 family)
MPQPPAPCLVSACLVGLCTRYDGCLKTNDDCLRTLMGRHWIPVCPEQLGGLATPRPAADLVDGDGHAVLAGTAQVLTKDGVDVSQPFIKGAEQVLQVARLQGSTLFLAKSGSPSCGLGTCPGVTTALLLANGLQVQSF